MDEELLQILKLLSNYQSHLKSFQFNLNKIYHYHFLRTSLYLNHYFNLHQMKKNNYYTKYSIYIFKFNLIYNNTMFNALKTVFGLAS